MPWPGGFDAFKNRQCKRCIELEAQVRALRGALEKIRRLAGQSKASWLGEQGAITLAVWEAAHNAIEALATPPAPARPDGPYLCSARKGGTDAGDPCMNIEGHEGGHTFAKLRPFATPPTPRTEKGDTYSDGSPRYQDDPTPPAGEGGEGMRAHRGDPCLYCHTRHDDVAVGPCPAAPRCPPHAYPWPGRGGSLCLTCGAPRPAPAREEGRG